MGEQSLVQVFGGLQAVANQMQHNLLGSEEIHIEILGLFTLTSHKIKLYYEIIHPPNAQQQGKPSNKYFKL